jgi:hypothetical protein
LLQSLKNKQSIFKVSIIILCVVLVVLSPVAYVLVVLPPDSVGFTVPCTINTYGTAWSGALAFDFQNLGTTGQTGYYVVVMDTDGNLLDLRDSSTSYGVVNTIEPDTILFQGEPHVDGPFSAPTYATHIWNLTSGTTADFPNVIGHHDIQYNPENDTFLTFQSYVRQVGNNTYLFDKIIQLDANGTLIWTWDTYDHIPLNEASTFNETSVVNNQTVIDFSHANALDWDYNNDIIYLNLRCTNTFYKINQTSGNIIWACGQFGDFMLLGDNGQPVTSLWYHSHNTKQISPNVFTMFDNDFNNITNPNDCRSRLIELTVNETKMTAYVSWSWQAPTQYWNNYAGGALLLPNGDILGDFGDPTHQLPQNKPWNFNDTGAVLVEVNPSGEVVKTFTFPVGCYIYRVAFLPNPPSGNFVIPVPIPQFLSPTPYSVPTATVSASPTTPITSSNPTPAQSTNPTTMGTPSPTAKAPANSNVNLETEFAILFALIITSIALLSVGFFRTRRHLNLKTNGQ